MHGPDAGQVAGLAATLASLLVLGASIPESASAGELALKGCITASKEVGPPGPGLVAHISDRLP
jgi:hypothetical protein